MSRPKLLDLFCCQGAASQGYQRAGFNVVGVDIDQQPRYPFEFHQSDALKFLLKHHHEFDAFHASPPCQAFTNAQKIRGNEHDDFIAATRSAFQLIGKPWVIENVPGAPVRADLELCGATFGLHTYRHRLFESSIPLHQPLHRPHLNSTVKMGRAITEGDWYHAVGNFSGVDYVRRDLGVPWMTRDGIRECIPPAYTEHIGRQLMEHIGGQEAAA